MGRRGENYQGSCDYHSETENDHYNSSLVGDDYTDSVVGNDYCAYYDDNSTVVGVYNYSAAMVGNYGSTLVGDYHNSEAMVGDVNYSTALVGDYYTETEMDYHNNSCSVVVDYNSDTRTVLCPWAEGTSSSSSHSSSFFERM